MAASVRTAMSGPFSGCKRPANNNSGPSAGSNGSVAASGKPAAPGG
jgi:hypothetical protein